MLSTWEWRVGGNIIRRSTWISEEGVDVCANGLVMVGQEICCRLILMEMLVDFGEIH